MVEDFIRDGFVALRSAVPSDLVERARADIESELRTHGVDLGDASTWSEPVVRINCPETPAFAAAGTQPILWATYDALLGPGTWWKRQGVGGTIASSLSVGGRSRRRGLACRRELHRSRRRPLAQRREQGTAGCCACSSSPT